MFFQFFINLGSLHCFKEITSLYEALTEAKRNGHLLYKVWYMFYSNENGESKWSHYAESMSLWSATFGHYRSPKCFFYCCDLMIQGRIVRGAKKSLPAGWGSPREFGVYKEKNPRQINMSTRWYLCGAFLEIIPGATSTIRISESKQLAYCMVSWRLSTRHKTLLSMAECQPILMCSMHSTNLLREQTWWA